MKRVAVLRKGGRCLDYHPTGDTIAVGLNDGMSHINFNFVKASYILVEADSSGIIRSCS